MKINAAFIERLSIEMKIVLLLKSFEPQKFKIPR